MINDYVYLRWHSNVTFKNKHSECNLLAAYHSNFSFVDAIIFPAGSAVTNLHTVQKTWVRSLGGQDPLEEEMTSHSSILACRIPWTEEPGRLQSKGHKESDTIEHIVYESKIYPILSLS